MNFKTLVYAAAAVLMGMVSCKQPENLGPAAIKVSPSKLEFDKGSDSKTVQLTATRDWTVVKPDWVEVMPEYGKASSEPQTVTVTVKSNTGFDKEENVVFTIGMAKAPLKVSQKGEKGEYVMETLTVKDFIAKASATEYYRLRGTVSKWKNDVNSSGKEYMQFDLTDDTGSITVYGFKDGQLAQWKDKIKNGGTVLVNGTYQKYTNANTGAVTNEVMNATIESFEPKEEQTVFEDKTVAQFIQLADKVVGYRLTGKVSNFRKGVNDKTQKPWMEFDLVDDTGSIDIYGFADGEYDKWNEKLKDNGTIVLHGTYDVYNGKHEVVGTVIESFEEGQEQTEFESKTVAEFIQLASGTTAYRLTGTVSSFQTRQNNGKNYMQFNLTDDTGTILAYGFKDGQYDEWATKIKDNGTVVLHGTYQKYTNSSTGAVQDEVMNVVIESFTEGQEQTEFENKTVAEFIAAASAVTFYRLSGKVSEFTSGTNSSGKDYMQFNLTDASGSILVYSFKDGEIDKWKGQIKDGGDVVLRGQYQLYNNTPEVVNAVIESFTEDANYKSCTVSTTKIDAKATDTEASFTITANSAWTITSDNDAFTVTPASGDGDATVKVSFSANEAETPRVANIKVSCPGATLDAQKEQTIVLTQAKATAAGVQSVEFDIAAIATAKGWTNSTQYKTITIDNVTLTANGGGNTGKYYTSGNQWRFYQNESAKLDISVSSGELVSAVISYASSNSGVLLDASGAQVATDSEVSLSGTTASFSVGNSGGLTNGQVRFTKIVVNVK